VRRNRDGAGAGLIAEEFPMTSRNSGAERQHRATLAHLGTIEVLERTHREIVEMLTRMHLLVEKVEVRGIDDSVRKLAADICRFFDETARPHHAAEEEFVFPDLLGSGDLELVRHVQRLQHDHARLEEHWLDLAPHLQAVANGQSWYDIVVLRADVSAFTELYRDHIALEKAIVYPASRRHHRSDLPRSVSLDH
jgi:hemerythrin-like domain-containing protein